MAKFLLMTTKEKGHLNPMVGIAKHLMRRDHEVGWCCLPYAPDYLAEMGIEDVPLELPETDGDDDEEDFITEGAELAELVRDPERLYPWLRTLLVDNVGDLVEPTRGVLVDWNPDVLVVDPMLYGGIIAAELEEVPYACVSTSLVMVAPNDMDGIYQQHMRQLDPERHALFEDYGLSAEFKLVDCLSPHLNIVLIPAEYIGDDGDIPKNTYLVGPSFPPGERGDEVDFPWDILDERPTIYASFGSQIYYQPEIFERISRATAALDVQVIISCGDLANSDWAESLPDHVHTFSYTPQRELLERVDLMVTHGGANSVREALAAGVPLLISPVCNDQPIQAHFIRKRGVGTELDLFEASDDEAREALEELLDDDAPQRDAVDQVAPSFSLLNGARQTAKLVETLLS